MDPETQLSGDQLIHFAIEESTKYDAIADTDPAYARLAKALRTVTYNRLLAYLNRRLGSRLDDAFDEVFNDPSTLQGHLLGCARQLVAQVRLGQEPKHVYALQVTVNTKPDVTMDTLKDIINKWLGSKLMQERFYAVGFEYGSENDNPHCHCFIDRSSHSRPADIVRSVRNAVKDICDTDKKQSCFHVVQLKSYAYIKSSYYYCIKDGDYALSETPKSTVLQEAISEEEVLST